MPPFCINRPLAAEDDGQPVETDHHQQQCGDRSAAPDEGGRD